jgi:hypothetical protein
LRGIGLKPDHRALHNFAALAYRVGGGLARLS